MNLIERIQQNLIRKDGRLNSGKLKSKSIQPLLIEIKQATSFLPETAELSQRWWHILNGFNPPICLKCKNPIMWDNHNKVYKKYCSQHCAATSIEASNRTSLQFKGKIVPIEQTLRQKETRKKNGYYKDREATIKKLSIQKLGVLNPQFGKVGWNKGICGELNPRYGIKRPGTGIKGALNPQFGKSPSKKAGKGIWGKFNNIHFRSSLEMLYLMYWYEHNIESISAETSDFRVTYISEHQLIRTYSPDFYLPSINMLVEIKPEKLHTNVQVLLKLSALKNKHQDKQCTIIGFKPIKEFINHTITNKIIDDYIDNNLLIINEKQLTRLRKNYADIIRATL